MVYVCTTDGYGLENRRSVGCSDNMTFYKVRASTTAVATSLPLSSSSCSSNDSMDTIRPTYEVHEIMEHYYVCTTDGYGLKNCSGDSIDTTNVLDPSHDRGDTSDFTQGIWPSSNITSLFFTQCLAVIEFVFSHRDTQNKREARSLSSNHFF